MSCSNFQLIIKAENDTLWAIGICEHDRNAVLNPVPVQTDFHHYIGAADKMHFKFPPGAFLRKGTSRVVVICPNDPSAIRNEYAAPNRSPLPLHGNAYHIVLHNDEAYLIELNIEVDPVAIAEVDGYNKNKLFRVLDYSEGWQHSLVVIDDGNNS